jgi:hypothetical protein
MSFIRQLIERKISAATGAVVAIGQFSFSPFSGVVEILDLKVSVSRFVPPVLGVERIFAKLSVTRALKQEIVLKELSIEKPSITIQVRSDGTSNLTRPDQHKSETPEKDKQAGGAWEFECSQISIVDAYFHLHHFGHEGWKVAIERLNGFIKSDGNDLQLKFLADTCGRRDIPLELGALSLDGKVTGAGGFKNFPTCGLDAMVKLSSNVAAKLTSSVLANRNLDCDLAASIKLPTLLQLLPDDMRLPVTFEGDAPVNLKSRASFGRERGFKLQSLELKTSDLAVATRR